MLTRFMAENGSLLTKKRRGPKPTGKGTLIGVRLQPDQLAMLDAYRAKCPEGTSRPEALRRAFSAWAGSSGLFPRSDATENTADLEAQERSPSDEDWWTGLSASERAAILETEGIKRKPHHPWRSIGRGVQKRLSEVRKRTA